MKLYKRKSDFYNLLSLHQYLEKEYLDSKGNAVIDVRLYEGLEIFNPLSMGKQEVLNQEIIDYIDSRSAIIPTTIPLIVRFHHPSIPVADQDRIRSCLTEHYSVIMHDKEWDRRINRRKIILLAVLGIAVLAAYLTMVLYSTDSMRTEVLSIIASFSLWEATELFLLERRNIRNEIWDTAQHLSQRIEFVND